MKSGSTAWDVVVIGSGIGGLVAGALLARYGKRVVVCESHSVPGGAAHGFSRQGFHFDSGPSFYCGLGNPKSGNPLSQILHVLGESIPTIAYDPLGYYHFPDHTLPIYGNAERYRAAIAAITPQGAQEFAQLESRLLQIYKALRPISPLMLRADWRLFPLLLRHHPVALLKLLPHSFGLQRSVGDGLKGTVRDPWVRRLIDLECFLLSGLKAEGTIAPELAFMLGERSQSGVDYPLGGSQAIVQALVRGLQRWGGQLRLNTPVEKIRVDRGRAAGVQLRSGEYIPAPIVISNATIWDTYGHLLHPDDLPLQYRRSALQTPAIESFMHVHLGIRAAGIESLTGHHVVVHDTTIDLAAPGNTCMISIPTVWDASLAPPGYHALHAYTLEPFAPWQTGDIAQRKRERSAPLFRAIERVIPDWRDRLELQLIGTPLTHARFLRRYQGTYGPAIAAGQGTFPSGHTPIAGLYRVGDSTLPGIGVPAVAASGILCANHLVHPQQTLEMLAR